MNYYIKMQSRCLANKLPLANPVDGVTGNLYIPAVDMKLPEITVRQSQKWLIRSRLDLQSGKPPVETLPRSQQKQKSEAFLSMMSRDC